MAKLDNPAGRLHAILKEYDRVASGDLTIHQTWAKVLGVENRHVGPALAEVAGLIPAIQSTVSRLGNEEQEDVVKYHIREWSSPIFPPNHAGTQKPSPGKALIDDRALVALGGLSAYLSSARSEGTIPDDEQVAALKQEIAEAIEALAVDEDIPPETRQLLFDRLRDILWAVERLRTGGPGSVRAAAERLAVVIITAPEAARKSPAMEKAASVGKTAWSIFSAAPKFQANLEALTKLAGMLGMGG